MRFDTTLPRCSLILALAAAAATLSAPGNAAAEDLPMRKAGLWHLATTMDEGSGPRDSSFKMCIDADMERNTVQASQMEHQQNCTRYEVSRAGDAVSVDADCTFSGAAVQSHTEMKGDFQQGFEVKIESTTVRKGAEQSISVKRKITQSGNYLSEACGDLGPGEAMGDDGKKIAVQ